MADIRIIKNPITKTELKKIAEEKFGDLAKAAVDIEKKIMAVGGELHADMETLLMEKENSLRKDTWGINLYPENSEEDFIEFDSMINLKPALGNRTRNVEDEKTAVNTAKLDTVEPSLELQSEAEIYATDFILQITE